MALIQVDIQTRWFVRKRQGPAVDGDIALAQIRVSQALSLDLEKCSLGAPLPEICKMKYWEAKVLAGVSTAAGDPYVN